MKKFFTFEGIDGSGKEAQLLAFVHALKNGCTYFKGNKHGPMWLTREPTKLTWYGEEICRLLKTEHVSAEDATKLFVADRIEHTKKHIVPELKRNNVLSSRYDLSTLAFQMAQGADFDELYALHNYGKRDGARIPDITFVLDLPPKVALQRIDKRGDKREYFEKDSFQEKVAKAQRFCIDKLRALDGRTIVVVNANQTIPEVTDELLRKAAPHL